MHRKLFCFVFIGQISKKQLRLLKAANAKKICID